MLYRLNVEKIESSERIEIGTPAHFGIIEQQIEDFLKSRLDEVVSEDQLMLIGQERKWQEEADLLALDKDGILYIFELKRWESNQENILQVMRYGQIFGRYSYEELEALAQRQQKLDGSLKEKHRDYFHLDKGLAESEFNKDQVFVLVTNGMDGDAISAVQFWSDKGVNIQCSPYRIYDIDGSPYIQFDTYSSEKEIVLEENTNYFVVNTNRTYMSDAWKDMLNGGKASAYYDRKNSVHRISKNSRVYLYHTRVGVIGSGIALSEYDATDYEGDEDEEYFVPLKFRWPLFDENQWAETAPKAWEINERCNSGHRFRQTVFSITKEMADAIDSIAQEKGWVFE